MLLKRGVMVGSRSSPARPASSRAATEVNFDAVADASAARSSPPGGPLADSPVDGGGSRATAAVSSFGVSRARAAQPHPGDLAISAPNLVRPFPAGSARPAAQCPSPRTRSWRTRPTPPRRAPASPPAQWWSRRRATSWRALQGERRGRHPRSSERDGGGDHHRHRRAGRGGRAHQAAGLEVGPLVIEGLRSSAKVVRSGSGLKRQSSLSPSGQRRRDPLTVDDRGINVAGTTLPYQDAGPLVGVLAQAGITLAYEAGRETKFGVVSPNLIITVRQPVPDNPVASVPSVTYTFILGEASASVGGQAFTDADPVVTPEQPTSEPAPAPVLKPETPALPPLDSGSAPLDPGTAVSPPVVDSPAAEQRRQHRSRLPSSPPGPRSRQSPGPRPSTSPSPAQPCSSSSS